MTAHPTTFYVRGMVCPRCVLLVDRLLRHLGLTPLYVELGEVHIAETDSVVPWAAIGAALEQLQFTLLQPPARVLAFRLRATVAELLSTTPNAIRADGAGHLATLLECRPDDLRAVCRVEFGCDLPRYLVRCRIGAAQMLLRSQPELSVQEVARRLGYSSQAHLCRQFRTVAGCPPSRWRRAQQAPNDQTIPSSSSPVI